MPQYCLLFIMIIIKIKVWTFWAVPFPYETGCSFQHNLGHPMDLVPLGV
jgi:hypothetical protein